MSEKANRNILKLARDRKLDRVAVMINRDYLSREAVSELKKAGVKIDLHLELPARKSKKHKLKDDIARRGLVFLVHYILGRNGQKRIRHEWRMQIEKFKEIFGKFPEGLNSHEYIHFFPPYFKAAADLAKEYGIKFIRFGKKGPLKKKSKIYKILDRLQKVNGRKFESLHLESTDYFVSLDWISDPKLFLHSLPDGVTELITHPEREQETELINKYF